MREATLRGSLRSHLRVTPEVLRRIVDQKMAGIAPGHFLVRCIYAFAPWWRGAGRRWRQCSSTIQQRRDVADGDATVFA
jgi:hypothetical protein